jgi:NNP family nitrate/nitrite transporter-like MFS transporter
VAAGVPGAAWDPEDVEGWARGGWRVARRNLLASVFSEHIGFSVWAMWSVLVLFLGPDYGFAPEEKFLLTAVPALVGSLLRIPYTLAVAAVGGRRWTVISSLLLLVPTVWAALVLRPGVSFPTLVLVAALAGVGGGNFASSMANINAYFPLRLKGWALGINAGAGNLGVAVVQLVGLAVLAVAGAGHPTYVLAVYIPLIVVAALVARLTMDSVPVESDGAAMRALVREPHAWVISLLYVGTFGSFIGFGFAFGQVLLVQFPERFATPLAAACLTFLGPLIGSVMRPLGGRLADRRGGAVVTAACFAGLAAGSALVLVASLSRSLPLFLLGFVSLFTVSGLGNGSTYRLIPVALPDRRRAGALMGVAGAVGGLGGVAVNLALRQSFLATGNADAAYALFTVAYLVLVGVTWAVYLRPRLAVAAA